jgi:hypothetical protein
MAEFLLRSLTIVASGLLVIQTLRFRKLIVDWTAATSVVWLAVAAGFVSVAAMCSLPAVGPGPGWCGTLHYLAAILLLTPAICTLGARRPGAGPWQWFVVLPMILVLLWPVLTQAIDTGGRTPVELSNPQLCGFVLAAVMGFGPSVGTPAAAPTLLRIAAVIVALLPVRTSAAWAGSFAAVVPLLLLCELALLRSRVCATLDRLHQAVSLHDRTREIWLLFLTLYGSVWPRRVLDRISQFERGERWTVTLREDGFHAHSGAVPRDEELQKPLEAFRWLLSRFVTSDWMNREFERNAGANQAQG